MIISLNFVPIDTIDNESTLFQVMACGQAGDKPLPEQMHDDPIYWVLYASPGAQCITM